MMALLQAQTQLEQLGLTEAAAVIESRLDDAAREEISYAEFLTDLLGVETNARRERYLVTRTRLAHFPFRRTLEMFDFSFQPSVDERQVRELSTLAFVADAANVILLGPPGVGRTHLAVGLGVKAIEHGHGVCFVKAHHLIEDLRRPHSEQRLDRRMRVYLSPKVLIVDEFGVWPYDRTAGMLLFALVSARYERGSMILTSNKSFADWGDVLGDPVVATAILDRLLHHSDILNIRGESYRLKEKKRAGLFGRLPIPPTTEQASEHQRQQVGQSQTGGGGSNLTRR